MEIAFSDSLMSHQCAIVTCYFQAILQPCTIQFTESNIGLSATFSFVLIIFQISHCLYLQLLVMLLVFHIFLHNTTCCHYQFTSKTSGLFHTCQYTQLAKGNFQLSFHCEEKNLLDSTCNSRCNKVWHSDSLTQSTAKR